MGKTKRIKWLDFAKCFAILCVVISHCFGVMNNSYVFVNYISYIMGIFMMPVFFAISGYLFNPSTNAHKYIILLCKKIKGFIIPYVVFTIISNIGVIFLHNNGKSAIYAIHRLVRSFLLPIGGNYLWFLWALFVIFVLVGALYCIGIPLKYQIVISLICLIFECVFLKNVSTNAYFAFGYLSCFYIGIVLRKYNLLYYLHNKVSIITLTLLFILLINTSYFINNKINTDGFDYIDFVPKLVSIVFLFALFVSINKQSRVFQYFTYYGRYTLIIYLVHIPIIFVISRILNKIGMTLWLQLIIGTALTWFLSLFVVYMAKRINIINFVFYPRKYIR